MNFIGNLITGFFSALESWFIKVAVSVLVFFAVISLIFYLAFGCSFSNVFSSKGRAKIKLVIEEKRMWPIFSKKNKESISIKKENGKGDNSSEKVDATI